MHIKIFSRFTAPGAVAPRYAIVASLSVTGLIFLSDVLTPANIRLHFLYIFPLACMALHCASVTPVIGAALLSGCLQLLTFFIHHEPASELITDSFVAFSATLLIIVLARNLRANFLAVEHLAKQDALTELHNRRSFEDIAEKEIARQRRYGGVFSLASIDLDKFKQLNDSKGHLAGDLALKLVAKILVEHTRDVDVVARLGGDEFAILMPSTAQDDCQSVCSHLSDAIKREMHGAGFDVEASIGFISFGQPPDSLSAALHLTDRVMYAVKEGKAQSYG